LERDDGCIWWLGTYGEETKGYCADELGDGYWAGHVEWYYGSCIGGLKDVFPCSVELSAENFFSSQLLMHCSIVDGM
jgi:hypothetical protein